MKKIKFCPFIGPFLLILIFTSCRKDRDLLIFIPQGYEGEIVIEWQVDSSKNEIFRFADEGYTMFLKGKDLSYYTFKNGPLKDGGYRMRFFYYTDSSLCELETGPTFISDTIKLGGISTGKTSGIKHMKDYIILNKNQQCKSTSANN